MSPAVCLEMLFNPILNTSQDISHVVFHISVMKSQEMQSQLLQIPFTSLIILELVAVTIAINLDHQFQLRAIEIDNVFVNGSLSQEGIAQHFAALQFVPEQYFRQGAGLPEFTRTLFQFWVVVKHGLRSVLGC